MNDRTDSVALTLSYLGSFQASLGARALQKFRTSKVQALLIYLTTEAALANGESAPRREALMELLWPDLPLRSAQVNLRQILYRLRQAIPEVPAHDRDTPVPFLLADRQMVQVNPDADVRLDVEHFQQLVRNAAMPEHDDPVDRFAEAVALYRGDFLADFYLPDSAAFEDWAGGYRAAFRQEALGALAALGEHYIALSDYAPAITYARRQLELDDLREGAYRQLMTALALDGQRSAALNQYEVCRQRLEVELGIVPTEKTTALFERIQGDALRVPRGVSVSPERPKIVVQPEPATPAASVTPQGAPPTNLRAQVTAFIGREEEVLAIDALIADSAVRLVTIVGPGGIGKTRLAAAVAERLLAATELQLAAVTAGPGNELRFPNGVFFVPLAAIDTPELIVPALADALGMQMRWADQAHYPPHQQVLDYLREKRLFLVMDNFEHLLDGATFIAEILRVAPGVQIVITSRERLSLREEQVYPIEGLEVPERDCLDGAIDCTAAQLFVQAARRTRSDFTLADGDARHLVRICRLVDGMPLALELAASWVDMLSLADIAEEIKRNLDFLESVWRDMAPRHRSIRATIDASWGRLMEPQKQMFARLSVFRGGFTREAARDVAETSLRTLAELVNKSLVRYDRYRDRYTLHELLRQYAAERLTANAGEHAAVHNRHSAYYCEFLRNWEVKIKGASQSPVQVGIEVEAENIWPAWMWAVKHVEVARLDQAALGLYFFCEWYYRAREGGALCTAAVEALQRVPASPYTARVIARLEITEAALSYYVGRWEKAETLLHHSWKLLNSDMFGGHDTRLELATYYYLEGMMQQKSPEEGLRLLDASLALYRALEKQWDIANVLRNLGQMAILAGQLTKAKVWLEEALAIFQTLNNRPGTLRSLLELGMLFREMGDFVNARHYYEKALVWAQRDPWGEGGALQRLAWLAIFQGQFDEAEALYIRARARFQEIGYRVGEAVTLELGGIAPVYWLTGRFAQACEAMERAMAIYDELGDVSRAGTGYAVLAEIKACAGDIVEARSIMPKALEMARRSSDAQDLLGRAHRALSWIALVDGDYTRAQETANTAVTSYRALKYQWGQEYLAMSLAPLVRAEIGLGQTNRAAEYAVEGLDVALKIRGFLPLLFLVPVVSHLMVELGRVERAIELYAMAETQPFVVKSPLMHDVVRQHIKIVAKTLPPDVVQAAQSRGRDLDWWTTVELLLAELREAV